MSVITIVYDFKLPHPPQMRYEGRLASGAGEGSLPCSKREATTASAYFPSQLRPHQPLIPTPGPFPAPSLRLLPRLNNGQGFSLFSGTPATSLALRLPPSLTSPVFVIADRSVVIGTRAAPGLQPDAVGFYWSFQLQVARFLFGP